LLTEYQRAPRVTRDRLYLEAIEEVYAKSNKVLIDSEGSGNLLYLPIDKLIGGGTSGVPGSEASRASDAQTPEVLARPERTSDEARDRRTRQ